MITEGNNMIDILKKMASRLSPEDKQAIKKIVAPYAVAAIPGFAYTELCVMPDGEIRHYGHCDKAHPEDYGRPIYIASKDCGLSWKTYEAKPDLLGPGIRMSSGRYIRPFNFADSAHGAPPCVYEADSPDAVPVKIPLKYDGDWSLADCGLPPLELKKRKRIIFASCCRLDEGTPKPLRYRPVFFYSDDGGNTWKYSTAGETPGHKGGLPHRGARWANYGYCEAAIAELSDGTLYVLYRGNEDYLYQYYSYDGGETWTAPELSTFHATHTFPYLHSLSDGRLLLIWCNTHPLPELDHGKCRPPVPNDVKTGRWEDVFTNRDANHAAISEDGGKTWKGFREIALNGLRNTADFRNSHGGTTVLRDKSVHQFQALELPFDKVLLAFGQHPACARLVVFDPAYLYETDRKLDFAAGDDLSTLSTQMYVKSVLASRTPSGHCAYNRTNGALLVPDPDGSGEQALQVCRIRDKRLVCEKQGAVWNFPASYTGKATVKMRILKNGIKLSLCEMWINPVDEYIGMYSHVSVDITKDMLPTGKDYSDVTLAWDVEKKFAILLINNFVIRTLRIEKACPHGLSYLHVQTLAEKEDFQGTLIKRLMKE
jgi:hypothetical protein